jgi:hypothetical protein
MQLTPTVISAQPLEKAIRAYLDRHDLASLVPPFLEARRATQPFGSARAAKEMAGEGCSYPAGCEGGKRIGE